jgi:hypothetical protein
MGWACILDQRYKECPQNSDDEIAWKMVTKKIEKEVRV